MERDQQIPPLQFPYHLGPTTRKLGTSILFHGEVAASPPAWMGPILEAFTHVGERAKKRNSAIEPLLARAWHYFDVAQRAAMGVFPVLEEVGKPVSKVLLAYPGTQENYDDWSHARTPTINNLIALELDKPEGMFVASTELIWRIYERSLLPESPDDTVSWLEQHVSRMQHPMELFVEGYLNRYTMAFSSAGKIKILLSSTCVLHILRELGQSLTPFDPSPVQVEQLAFVLFDNLLGRYTPALNTKADGARIARLLNSRAVELEAFRMEVRRRAEIMIAQASDGAKLAAVIHPMIEELSKKVSEIADLDRASRQSLVRAIKEDSTMWTTAAGLLSYFIDVAPGVVSAALAVSALSSVGASAMRVRHDREARLNTSPWSFVYYLQE